jgi:hypothetical protein
VARDILSSPDRTLSGHRLEASRAPRHIVYSFADVLAPGFAGHLIPWIQLPSLIGEGTLAVWLLVAGVNTLRWTERARFSSISPTAVTGSIS